MKEAAPVDYSKPVAYDIDGRPLYAHPPTEAGVPAGAEVRVQEAIEHATEVAHDSAKSELEAQLKRDASKQYYPQVTLKHDEYIIASVKRHPIGLFLPFLVGIIGMSFLLTLLFNYTFFVGVGLIPPQLENAAFGSLLLILCSILVGIGVYVAYFVYTSNRFFITNKSVIQHLQVGLFSRKEQIVALENIEDASYHQRTIAQQFFNYGSLKISVESNGSQMYRFTFAENPQEYLGVLNDAIYQRTNALQQRN